ncbi:hypothetical protein GQ55_5G366400 [Panicum hallii var. hallii]|uniref:Uncharacterized protein n=1 Tax=Panicum hallii var. hallii TaxID=1504633 RepID=A0A2T7DMK0_9POAL|nr:hypothetical protein GQ55_5G366400 [Panicum hallii var. hallii]PUZ56814.1 hypothetical protein GQ55_5G366400 [Panicum hallii var. hallii]
MHIPASTVAAFCIHRGPLHHDLYLVDPDLRLVGMAVGTHPGETGRSRGKGLLEERSRGKGLLEGKSRDLAGAGQEQRSLWPDEGRMIELRRTSTPTTFVEVRIYQLESLSKYIQEYLGNYKCSFFLQFLARIRIP